MQTKTKLKIYRSNVWFVLLYATETWKQEARKSTQGLWGKMSKANTKDKLGTTCYQQRRTGINNIVEEVRHRRWRWLGHVLRMNKNRHPHAALRWAPPGKRKRGRPLGTWRRNWGGDEGSRKYLEWSQLASSGPWWMEEICRCLMLQPEWRGLSK